MSDLSVRDLQVVFDGEAPPALDLPQFGVTAGDRVAITGPSGSGKTTLAYALTGIQPVARGTIHWAGSEITRLAEGARDRWRRGNIGMIFQDFHLVPGMSVLQNVLASIYFSASRPTPEQTGHARGLLDRCGVPAARGDVATLSRGEQQRVALARALLNDPPIVVADEPTASLDAVSAGTVIDLLLRETTNRRATLLCVTHDPVLIAALDRTVRLENGRLT